jgi:hypothetical protein
MPSRLEIIPQHTASELRRLARYEKDRRAAMRMLGSCPRAWCNWRGLASMLGRAGTHQLAMAGRLTMGSWLIGAMVSSVM